MDKELEDLLRRLPQTPQRSRLAPYAELISELRVRGWSYREIARILAEKCGIQVSYRNVHHFVQIREITTEAAVARKSQPTTPNEEPTHGRLRGPDISQRIAALKKRAARPEHEGLDFEFDPTVPLRLGSSGNRPSGR